VPLFLQHTGTALLLQDIQHALDFLRTPVVLEVVVYLLPGHTLFPRLAQSRERLGGEGISDGVAEYELR
jgi:hypothetical protein